MTSEPTISVVVPTRNEGQTIRETLRRLREPAVREVIVVDGGSADGTLREIGDLADRVLVTAVGRARQMNAGARAASGDVLFFLHADTHVPPGFAAAIVDACRIAKVVGGRFDVEIDGRGLRYRWIAAAINLRSRWTGLFTGDQGLFIRREAFEALGGFPDVPLFEDLELAAAMKRRGQVACLREKVVTSARRWQREGVVRTVVLMWALRGLRFAGVSPQRLARLYQEVR